MKEKLQCDVTMVLHVDLTLPVVKGSYGTKFWIWKTGRGIQEGSFVAAGSKEGCCLTPWRFVGDALAEIGREQSRAFI